MKVRNLGLNRVSFVSCVCGSIELCMRRTGGFLSLFLEGGGELYAHMLADTQKVSLVCRAYSHVNLSYVWR